MKPQKTANAENEAGKLPANSVNSLADGGNQPDLADRVRHHAQKVLLYANVDLDGPMAGITHRAILSAAFDFAEEMMRHGQSLSHRIDEHRSQQETQRAIVAWLLDAQDRCDNTFKATSDHGVGCAREAYKRAADAIERGEWREG